MNRVFRCPSLAGLLLVACAALLLGACAANVQSDQVINAKARGDFDVTVQAYKKGEFKLNGAILSSLDLSSHFAYLKEIGKLPKAVLLERSDDSSVRKEHLRYMAAMAYTYGFTVYYTDDGELRRIIPTSDNDTEMRAAPADGKTQGAPEVERRDATHNPASPSYDRY